MDKIIVKGGKPLSGTIAISGAKNSTLPIMAAALLTDEPLHLTNVPHLRDVTTMMQLLNQHGAAVSLGEHREFTLHCAEVTSARAPYDLVCTMRASVLVMGPLVARHGRADISMPGGCAIGSRPVNLHLAGLEAMGATVTLEGGYMRISAPRLHGADIVFDLVTVTGTENLMMAAALADGRTTLDNAACEPEVVDLANCLNAMGANITGAGTSTIVIDGVERLHGASHRIIPDRIETGTYMVAGAITNGDVTLTQTNPSYLDAFITKLRQAGVTVETSADTIRVKGNGRPRAVDIKTLPYPGFPTDLQAQMIALFTIARGASAVTETIFENRFMHISELQRLGADITTHGNTAVVKGVERLVGAPVMATDLRASACLVLAGLAAEEETVISRVYHIDRGYERIEEKLLTLGANIRRISQN